MFEEVNKRAFSGGDNKNADRRLEAPPGHYAFTYSKLCHGIKTCAAAADRRRTCQMALGAVA